MNRIDAIRKVAEYVAAIDDWHEEHTVTDSDFLHNRHPLTETCFAHPVNPPALSLMQFVLSDEFHDAMLPDA